ncbi:MAG: hypothetical protein B6I36_03855 [Desulfobacteraceae bacterium 4572_35.1]|nr:MAG: hypothetical protein B6I36_03855 [Desulfobacteraceae bacterium 4572_35.1]
MAIKTRNTVRTCIACRTSVDQDELIRYVIAPDGALLVDYRHKLPGRGCYTCFNRECITRALRGKGFARALKKNLVETDLNQVLLSLQEQVSTRVLNLLGMARKAGLVDSGSQLVLSKLRDPRDVAFVLLVHDVSKGIGSKVRQSTARAGLPLFEYFDKATIGQALGLSERSVMAVTKSPLAQTLNKELQRYKYVMGEL